MSTVEIDPSAPENITDEEIIELSGIVPDRPKALLRTKPPGAVEERVTPCELRVPQEFGAARLHALQLLLTEADDLYTSGRALDPTEAKQLERKFDHIASELIIGASPEEIAALPFQVKRGLAARFFAADAELLMEMIGTSNFVQMLVANAARKQEK